MSEHHGLPVDVADPGGAWDRDPRQEWPPHGADADEHDTVVRNVQRTAAKDPDRDAVTCVPDLPDTEPDQNLTYGELDYGARSIAAWLAANFAPGDRAVLLYPTGSAFPAAFFGCLYAGVVAVPAPLPLNSSGSQLRRLRRILDASGASVVLIDAEHLSLVAELTEDSKVRCIATDAAPLGDAASWQPLPVRRQDLAMLQFTSGSTTEPKGVMLTHENLVYTIDLIVRAFHLPPRLHTVSWLPLYHDMGLIGGLLSAVRGGGHAAMMSPIAFLREPYRWLELAGRHGADLSPAPNFAFDLCVRRVPPDRAVHLDLRNWRVAANGAEPVHAGTLAAFRERFAPAGFRPHAMSPCYGMAEVGLFVTGSSPGEAAVVTDVYAESLERGEFEPIAPGATGPDDSPPEEAAHRALVSSGPDPFGYDARIVDPQSRRELPDGKVGELWLRGPSVAPGYWGLDEETATAFDGRTADFEAAEGEAADGEGPFLRTGDLAVRADGQLYITGRLKELIIVRGRNIYPQDLEARLGALHPDLAAGNTVAFGVDCADGEHVVILHELGERRAESGSSPAADPVLDPAELAGIAIADLTKYAGVTVANICFVEPGTIRHSTSGKKRRTHMRELFMAGALQPRYETLEGIVQARYRTAATPDSLSPSQNGAEPAGRA